MFNCYLDLSNLKRFNKVLGFNLLLTTQSVSKKRNWVCLIWKWEIGDLILFENLEHYLSRNLL
jgi:hypothetical protein